MGVCFIFKKFLNLVKEWPSNLYNVQTIITATLDRLDRERNNTVLLRALGELWVINSNELKNFAEMQWAFFYDMKKTPHKTNTKKERNWKQLTIISQFRVDFCTPSISLISSQLVLFRCSWNNTAGVPLFLTICN